MTGQKTDPLSEANKNINEGDENVPWEAAAFLGPTVRDPGKRPPPPGTPTWKGYQQK